MNAVGDLAAGWLAGFRSQQQAEVVSKVRQLRLELALKDWSDTDLRREMTAIRVAFSETQYPPDHVQRLATAFAIVDESIRRRLGSWRIFTGSTQPSSFENCFQASQGRLPLRALSPSERVVAEAIQQIRESGSGRYGSDHLFPADFYRALSLIDTTGSLLFQPTDEQLSAGLHLLENRVVEMLAGEGKTVAIAFAAITHALKGKQVHIITANDYLAERDCRLLAPVYRSLGFSAGTILEAMDGAERRAAYQCDIVYGALREFGFDFLRDRLAARVEDTVQPPLGVAIVDEADQALVDEADTPLIISGPPVPQFRPWARVQKAVGELVQEQHGIAAQYLLQLNSLGPKDPSYGRLLCLGLLADPHSTDFQRIARANPGSYRRGMDELYPDGGDAPDATLTASLLYVIDRNERFVTLTEKGIDFLSTLLGDFCPAAGPEYHASAQTDRLSRRVARQLALANQVYQSLRANLLLERDVHYVVTDDTFILLDQNSGRTRPDNTYRFGLQQAVEAREGVTVYPDCETLAQISVQDFASRYQFLAGITGTAIAAADEFKRRYSLGCTTIQPSQPSHRVDLPSRIFSSEKEKIEAIVEEVSWCRRIGRPVLVGTGSVNYSIKLSRALADAGIGHRVLNAVRSHEEADIVRNAGVLSAVTVATNMAGRGTDIVLDPDLNDKLLNRWSAFVTEEAAADRLPLRIKCGSGAEADLLAAALADSPGISASRSVSNHENVIFVTTAPCEPAYGISAGAFEREFGLGLHVISAEFNRFPRVALQLKGRSGRQGLFGSTRSMLSWEDSALLSLGQSRPALRQCQQEDSGGRICWEGRAVENYIQKRQENAEQEAAQRRSVAGDFASLIDAQSAAFYRIRQDFLAGPSVLARLPDLLLKRASRLVLEHFPNLDAANYHQGFKDMEREAAQRYGVDLSVLYGVSLSDVPDEIAARMRQALVLLEQNYGRRELDSLARTLCIETCDEFWRQHLADLHQSVFSSVLNGYGHKSAVADYIIHAADLWESFSDDLWDTVCSRLLTLPLPAVSRSIGAPQVCEEMHQVLLSLIR
ncbi:MAG: hypothetical protein OXE17_12545 [Chloroflexi bacterium]|nr:hypothetical protein [Chloroflexota bacterium]